MLVATVCIKGAVLRGFPKLGCIGSPLLDSVVTLPALVVTVCVDVVQRGVSTPLRLLNKVHAPVVMVGTVSLTVVTELPTPLTVPAPGPIAIVEGRVKVVMIVKVPIPICPTSRLPDPVVTVAMLVATVCIKGAVLR